MSKEADDALAFLASLRTRRARIDGLIAQVEAFLKVEGLLPAESEEAAPQPSNDTPAAAAHNAADTKKGAFTGMSLTDAVKKHLEQSKEPQTVAQIREALKNGGYPDTPHTGVYNAVWRRANRIKDVEAVPGNRWRIRAGGPQQPAADRKLGSRNGLTMFSGTEQILREAGRPLHAEDICARLTEWGKPTNVKSLSGSLPQDVQRRFENLGRNMWALKEWPPAQKELPGLDSASFPSN